MEEMKAALGTSADMTVFRKLRQLDYVSSYSHRGRYYTLKDGADFDRRGLWTVRGVHFSRFGSLVDTVDRFVTRSERGFLASELAIELQAEVKEPLRKLVSLGRIAREEISDHFVYCAAEAEHRRRQLQTRSSSLIEQPFAGLRDPSGLGSDETKAAIILFLCTLDEQQRRLYAGLESLRLGRGGDRRIASLTGLDVHTVAKGRRELLQRDLQTDRTRRPGAGRKPLEKKRQRSSPPSKS
jgi:hypothetical protein